MALHIVTPTTSHGRPRQEESVEQMLGRGVGDISDFIAAATMVVEDYVANDKRKIVADMAQTGTAMVPDADGNKSVPAHFRRKVIPISWDREGIANKDGMTNALFARHVIEALDQHKQRLGQAQNNGHWFVEKVELMDPALSSWTEIQPVPHAQHNSRDGISVESKLIFSGSGMSPTTAAAWGADMNATDGTREVLHPTFVLRVTYVDALGNKDKSYMDDKGGPSEKAEAPIDMSALGKGIAEGLKAAGLGAGTQEDALAVALKEIERLNGLVPDGPASTTVAAPKAVK